MAKTKIADVIVPEIFAAYVRTRILELSALIESGVVENSPVLDELAGRGGKLINMPFWGTISGDDEVLSDSAPLVPKKIAASQDVAALLVRGNAWSANELASALAGSSAMEAIGAQVARWWVLKEQAIFISILNGIFAGALAATHLNNISGGAGSAAVISPAAVLDTKQKLGDAADQFVAIAMHSAVFTALQKQNLITYIPNARGEVTIPTYLTYRVIVDDGCPAAAGVYSTYLFGRGVFVRGEGVPVDLTPVETARDPLASDDILIHRRALILHPKGVKFANDTVAGATPTNAELAIDDNWVKVYPDKAIGVALLKHKV
jgi:hypothetical protein